MKCKITNKKINPFMNFGKMPIANGFLDKKDFKNEYYFNMEVGFSEDLSLFQLNDHPHPEKMFNEKYPYKSSESYTMRNSFKKFSHKIIKKFKPNLVLEIGSNDGAFICNFDKKKVIGVEPCKNLARITRLKGYKTFSEYWNINLAKKITKKK